MSFEAFEKYARILGWIAEVIPEDQNSDYESGVVQLRHQTWHIRTARVTAAKPGGFVAFWCRDDEGKTQPFLAEAVGAGLLVFVSDEGRYGVFEFTRQHLAELGIVTGPKPGKRGFRVYPPWCTGLNKQATATQRAQHPAFREFSES